MLKMIFSCILDPAKSLKLTWWGHNLVKPTIKKSE